MVTIDGPGVEHTAETLDVAKAAPSMETAKPPLDVGPPAPGEGVVPLPALLPEGAAGLLEPPHPASNAIRRQLGTWRHRRSMVVIGNSLTRRFYPSCPEGDGVD
jgi:hypothetical protein